MYIFLNCILIPMINKGNKKNILELNIFSTLAIDTMGMLMFDLIFDLTCLFNVGIYIFTF